MSLPTYTKVDDVVRNGTTCPTCQQRHMCISVNVRADYGSRSVHVELCSQVPSHTVYASGSGYLAASGATAAAIVRLVQISLDQLADNDGASQ